MKYNMLKVLKQSDFVRVPMRRASCAFHDKNGMPCGAEASVAIPCRSRGGRSICFCGRHWMEMSIGYYTDENKQWLGVPGNGNGFTASIELETMQPKAAAFAELINNHFLPTSDCTVDVEFKSPIYRGLNSVSKICKTVQQLIDDGDMVIDGNCGTHFHVGHERYINSYTMEYLRDSNYYQRIFKPLADAIAANPRISKEVFGRTFGNWAEYPDFQFPENHTNFVNVQHDETIEFRQMFFANYFQYAEACKLCRDFTEIVINNFLQYVSNEGKEFLENKADIAGRHIVKKYHKFCQKMGLE